MRRPGGWRGGGSLAVLTLVLTVASTSIATAQAPAPSPDAGPPPSAGPPPDGGPAPLGGGPPSGTPPGEQSEDLRASMATASVELVLLWRLGAFGDEVPLEVADALSLMDLSAVDDLGEALGYADTAGATNLKVIALDVNPSDEVRDVLSALGDGDLAGARDGAPISIPLDTYLAAIDDLATRNGEAPTGERVRSIEHLANPMARIDPARVLAAGAPPPTIAPVPGPPTPEAPTTVTTDAGESSSTTAALAVAGLLVALAVGGVVIARRRSRGLEELAGLALVDALTGLGNRRALDEALTASLTTSGASGTPVSLVMVDVDHFKHFNDTHGHKAGDAALRHVAELLRSTAREGDRAFRYGGEEFCIIVEGLDETKAHQLAERIRAAVEANQIDGAESQPNGKLTVSMGVATAYGVDLTEFELLADRALYEAKRAGRNRVIAASMLDAATGAPDGPPAASEPSG